MDNIKVGRGLAIKVYGIFAIVVIGLVLAIMSFYNVDTGQVAIVKRFGKVIAIKEEGLNFKLPIVDKVYKMNTREQTLRFSYEGDNNDSPAISASTRDMQTVLVSITVYDIVTDPMGYIERSLVTT